MTMYSVLLVDDEKIIREGVYELLSMADLDLDLAMAASAVEAISVLEERKIDLVIADICMPQMTGLDLFDVIRERWPHCKVIFLTGYSEFDYVYKVHQHARYVLKAEEDWKLLEAVRDAIGEIENDLLLKSMSAEALEYQQYGKYYERMLLLKELVDGVAGFSDVTDGILASFNIDLCRDQDVYCVALRRDSDVSKCNYPDYRRASECMGALIHKYYMDAFGGTYIEYNRKFWYLLLRPKKLVTPERIVTLLLGNSELFQKAMNKNLGENVSVFISKKAVPVRQAFGDFSEIRDKMVTMAINEVKAGNAVREELQEMENLTDLEKQRVVQMVSRLDDGLQNFNQADIQNALGNLREIVSHVKSMHDLFILETYCSISSRLLGYIKKLNLTDKIAFRISIMNLYNVSLHESWDEAFAYLNRVVDSIFDLREQSMESKNEAVINKVKAYIYSHLDGDTSLYILAEHVHLSPEYLLRVFKQKEDITILQYINDLKLEKAKELLQDTQMQMKEIAVRLGFTSAGYFGRFFKSRMGITPHMYREACRNESLS